jgi:hypothetical protein
LASQLGFAYTSAALEQAKMIEAKCDSESGVAKLETRQLLDLVAQFELLRDNQAREEQ